MIKSLTAQLHEQSAAYTARTRDMHGREYHQKLGSHQQRECTQMERTRPTIGAHINGPFIQQRNARD
jgi:hypothetical protein